MRRVKRSYQGERLRGWLIPRKRRGGGRWLFRVTSFNLRFNASRRGTKRKRQQHREEEESTYYLYWMVARVASDRIQPSRIFLTKRNKRWPFVFSFLLNRFSCEFFRLRGCSFPPYDFFSFLLFFFVILFSYLRYPS